MGSITDPADPRLADYVGLTDVARRVKHEPERGFFIAEGEPVLRRALRAGYRCRSVLLADNRPLPEDLLEELPDVPVHRAGYDVLQAVTGFHVHRGVLASFQRKPLPSVAEVLEGATRVVVLEEVNNHTNLGAIFRSAAGLGMDAVLLDPRCCDPLYRRAVRVSMGEVFALPYAYLETWPPELPGFRVLALTPDPSAVPLDEVVLGPDERAALLLGAEGPGLTDAALAASDLRVRIPMARGVDSLNVAAAASVACWALGRRTG